MRIHRLIVCLAVFWPSAALSEDAGLDALTLVVRPGISDFDFPVGVLWECMKRWPRPAEVMGHVPIQGDRELVRIRLPSGLTMDYFFQKTADHALLTMVKAANGIVSSGPAELMALTYQTLVQGDCITKK